MVHRDHGGALRADFQRVYGLDLRVLLRGGFEEICYAADLAAYLPPGSMLWREVGGDRAWSDETTAALWVKHGVEWLAWQNAGDDKAPKPEPPKPPKTAEERERDKNITENKAARFMARQQRRRELAAS